MSTTRTVHVRVDGLVQGVFYRAWTEDTARELNLTGWVRNRRDGSVEMMLQGSAEKVAEMLKRCEDGPPAADVTRVMVEEAPDTTFASFEVKATA